MGSQIVNLKLKSNGDWAYRTAEVGDIVEARVGYVKTAGLNRRGVYVQLQPKKIEPDTGTGYQGESYLMFSGVQALALRLERKNPKALIGVCESIDRYIPELCARFTTEGQERSQVVLRHWCATGEILPAIVAEVKHAHFTNFGLSMAPPCADTDGFVAYREGYESLPAAEWTPAERWIAEQTAVIGRQR